MSAQSRDKPHMIYLLPPYFHSPFLLLSFFLFNSSNSFIKKLCHFKVLQKYFTCLTRHPSKAFFFFRMPPKSHQLYPLPPPNHLIRNERSFTCGKRTEKKKKQPRFQSFSPSSPRRKSPGKEVEKNPSYLAGSFISLP